MVDTAKRIGRDISGADVITVLAAPLMCPNFQRGFNISSGNVFKDLRIIPEFGRGRDLIITGTDKEAIAKLRAGLVKQFKVDDTNGSHYPPFSVSISNTITVSAEGT